MRRAAGFTLVEMAISLAIIALLLGMVMVPINAQIDQQRINDTQKQLNLIVEAALGFAVTTGRLPCPATATVANTAPNAGVETATCAAGAAEQGVVPWATLGMPELDAWGRRFTYRVAAPFADNPGGMQASFLLTDTGNITVRSGAGVDLATGVVLMVISHGKNGSGAYLPDGTRLALGTGDEAENNDVDGIVISKVPDPNFDDLVVWLSPNMLKSRMVAAGRLP